MYACPRVRLRTGAHPGRLPALLQVSDGMLRPTHPVHEHHPSCSFPAGAAFTNCDYGEMGSQVADANGNFGPCKDNPAYRGAFRVQVGVAAMQCSVWSLCFFDRKCGHLCALAARLPDRSRLLTIAHAVSHTCSQDPNRYNGKVMRIDLDTVGDAGTVTPTIISLGHRNPHRLHIIDGVVWLGEVGWYVAECAQTGTRARGGMLPCTGVEAVRHKAIWYHAERLASSHEFGFGCCACVLIIALALVVRRFPGDTKQASTAICAHVAGTCTRSST